MFKENGEKVTIEELTRTTDSKKAVFIIIVFEALL